MNEENYTNSEFEQNDSSIESENLQSTPPNPKQVFPTKLVAIIAAIGVIAIVGIIALLKPSNNSQTPSEPECIHQWIDADCLYPKTCRICQETSGTAKGHSFINATCTEPKTCRICNKTEGKAIRHTEVVDKAVAPTCTTKGFTEGKHCGLCGEILIKQVEINEKEHAFTTIVVAPTCTVGGYTLHSCICGESYKDNKTNALGHSWQGATCTKPKTCSVCSEEIYSPMGHNYSEKVVKPTCTESGYTVYTCRTCGDNFTSNPTNPTGHTEVIDPSVEPTTTSTGLTEGSHCSVCRIILVEQIVLPQKDSPSAISSFQIKKNDILRTYASLYDYNEYSIDYVEIDKKDTSDSEFQITVTIGAVMLLIPEDVDYVPDYIKGYWELVKDGETVDWDIFTISSVEELEYREVSFTCRNLEAGEYTLRFTSYI